MLVLSAGVAIAGTDSGVGDGARPGEYWLGADISWVPQDEARGAEYFDHGERRDVLELLAAHGFNAIRLRVFVDPLNGYARRSRDGVAWCGKEQTLQMARRVRAAGMALVIDFHYSDDWADPEHQRKPAAWEGMSVDELAQAVYDHTRDVTQALADQGTMRVMVMVGNEITHGLLWPEGRVSSRISSGNATTDKNNPPIGEDGLGNFDNFARFLRAGADAVRSVDPAIRVCLHNHLGRHQERVIEWMDQLAARGVDYDVIGLSCYSQSAEGDWERTFAEIARRYPEKGIVAAEYSNRKRHVNDLVFAIPGRRGWGSFIWEPTRHREAVFDRHGVNAGGEQGAMNFIGPDGFTPTPTNTTGNGDVSIAPAPAPAAPPAPRRFEPGGRYDANGFLDLYLEMARDYRTR